MAERGQLVEADSISETAMLTMKKFVLVLRVVFIRKVIVTRLLPANAAILTKEIADVSIVATTREQVSRSSNASLLELFMFC